MRAVNNEVYVYAGNALEKGPIDKIHVEGVRQAVLADGQKPYRIATFSPESKVSCDFVSNADDLMYLLVYRGDMLAFFCPVLLPAV